MVRLAMCVLAVSLVWSSVAWAQDGARREEEQPPPPKQPTLTKPPALIEGAAPEYPEKALEAGLEASVKVAVSQFSPLEMVAMEYFWT